MRDLCLAGACLVVLSLGCGARSALDTAGSAATTTTTTGGAGGGGGSAALCEGPWAAPPASFVERLGGPSLFSTGLAVAVDGAGQITLAGGFMEALDLGVGPLSPAAGRMFVARTSAAGVTSWSRAYGGGAYLTATGLAEDSAGNLVVVGHYTGTAEIGGISLPCEGAFDFFIMKLDPAGNVLWAKRFGDANDLPGSDDGDTSPWPRWYVAIDGQGDIVLTGSYVGVVDFGAGVTITEDNGHWGDWFLAKLRPDGEPLFAKGFGPGSGTALALDGDGNIAVTGYLLPGTDFGVGPLSDQGGIAVVKFDPAGGPLWGLPFVPAGYVIRGDVAVDEQGNIAASLRFDGSFEIDGQVYPDVGGDQGVVVAISPGGDVRWSRPSWADGLAADRHGGWYTLGTTYQGNVIGTTVLGELDADGSERWNKTIFPSATSGRLAYGGQIRTDAAGRLVLAGTLVTDAAMPDATLDLGVGPVLNLHKEDVVLAALTPCE